ncbi:PREDICTED: selenium-binding protein 1 [Polistes dominula]|uniref:Selenium-binding protein 1 n=1 Tax=Polistes dominula TaxID=743375 RepID=A0ABM1IXB3_POLDO|nr:PREDICTED: selenium-binding protein 1 [Polistes dominula]
MSTTSNCSTCHPGYSSPKTAMAEGPREKIMYTVCIHTDPKKPDVLSTVDIDPESPTYCKIIHKLRMLHVGDELHHSGWNICSSCYDLPRKRDVMVLPCLMSDRVYFIDTSNEREPKIKKGYDFWYQPYHDILIASEWGTPKFFKKGYFADHIADPKRYGRSLNIYSWSERTLKQTIHLGDDGIAPLEIRFLHDPKAAEGYVGCAVSSNIIRFYKTSNGDWNVEKVIDIPKKKVQGWIEPFMSGMITDILLSLDDKYLYLSNWLHGDIRQYDITDRRNPKLTGQVFLGGSILSDSKVRVLEDVELKSQPDPVYVKGRRLYGSPQMLQLSLDGRRLYVTTSIFKPWDKQFYPEHVEHGSTMVKLDVDVENGGMKLDEEFLVDFGEDKNDILLAHEIRYPGGDCTSDIWLPDKQ